MPARPLARVRHWCLTVNNPSNDDRVLFNDYTDVRYAIWQLEVGDSGTPHYQAYVEFKKAMTLHACARLHPAGHWEPRRGTREGAREYCRKEESRTAGPWEHGRWETDQGRRTDITEVKRKIDEGMDERQLWEEHTGHMLRYAKSWDRYKNLKLEPRHEKTQVRVYYGQTGAGKSYYVNELAGPTAFWLTAPKAKDEVWWDGYAGQEDVVIDEFYGWLRWNQLLRLLDAYPLTVPVKGGMVQFCAKRIWITSNRPPWEWYKDDFDYETLERRLDSIACVSMIVEERHVDYRKGQDPR